MSSTMTASNDLINGGQGKVVITIGGEVFTLANVKNLLAVAKKKKDGYSLLGKTGVSHKTVSWEGSGKMTLYYNQSILRKYVEIFQNTGEDLYCTLIVENFDKTSNVGTQTMQFNDVNFDSVCLAKIDTEKSALEEDVEFTFDSFIILDEFNKKDWNITL